MPRALATTLTLLVLAACPSTQKPEATPKREPIVSPAPPPAETPQPEPQSEVEQDSMPMMVFFVDEPRFAEGTAPYETAVERTRKPTDDEAEAIVNAYFAGPTEAERGRGLVALTHGLTGATVRVEGDIARVFTVGECDTNGAAYNVGSLLIRNVMQVNGVASVKIYDPRGNTQEPDGPGHSIPECMEP